MLCCWFCYWFLYGVRPRNKHFGYSPHFGSLCFRALVVDIEGSLLEFYCTVVSVCFGFALKQVLGLVDCLKVVVVGCFYETVLDFFCLCLC